MAKSKPSAPRSRNAKRTLSPPPPDLSNLPRPDDDGVSAKDKLSAKIAVLGVRGDQGVTKSKSKSKRLSSKQKKRADAAREKAEADAEKLARKTEESRVKAATVQNRRRDWEELAAKIDLEAEMERAVMKDGKVPVA